MECNILKCIKENVDKHVVDSVNVRPAVMNSVLINIWDSVRSSVENSVYTHLDNKDIV